jgi:predicted RNase H-like nuclease (RuvC/YqgF family)
MLTDIQALKEENIRHRQKIERKTETIGQLEKETADCRNRMEQLTDDNLRLIRENIELKLAIERLKALDIEIERKRKNLR